MHKRRAVKTADQEIGDRERMQNEEKFANFNEFYPLKQSYLYINVRTMIWNDSQTVVPCRGSSLGRSLPCSSE